MNNDLVLGLTRSDILGGNFSARLMQTVRDQEGLTYGINSFIEGVEEGQDGFLGVSRMN